MRILEGVNLQAVGGHFFFLFYHYAQATKEKDLEQKSHKWTKI